MKPGRFTPSQANAAVASRPAQKPAATTSESGTGTVKVPPVETGMGPAFGMAQVIAGVFRQAAAKDPKQASELRGSLTLQSADYASGVTVHFEGKRIRVMADVEPGAALGVECPALTLGKLGSSVFAVRAYLRREVKVRGMLRHPVMLYRVQRFLAVLDLS